MPIPTDTFWNIKRLNVVFALSSVALMAVTAWAILQDHDKDWRTPQRSTRVWEAAMVDDKIRREMTPAEKQKLADLQQQISDKEAKLVTGNKNYQDLAAQKKKLESDRATLEFKYNNLKSNVQVDEANLQDAITAQNEDETRRLESRLKEPRATLAAENEQLASLSQQIAEIKEKMDAQTAQLDALK